MEAAMYLEHTWLQIESGLAEKGFKETDIRNARIVFEGGIGAALVAIVKYGASVTDITQGMQFIDAGVAG